MEASVPTHDRLAPSPHLVGDGDFEGDAVAVDGDRDVLRGAGLELLLDGLEAHLADAGVGRLVQVALDGDVAAVGGGRLAVEEQHLRLLDGERLAALDRGVDPVVIGLDALPLGGGLNGRGGLRVGRRLRVDSLLIGRRRTRDGVGLRIAVVSSRLGLGVTRAAEGAESSQQDDHVGPGALGHR